MFFLENEIKRCQVLKWLHLFAYISADLKKCFPAFVHQQCISNWHAEVLKCYSIQRLVNTILLLLKTCFDVVFVYLFQISLEHCCSERLVLKDVLLSLASIFLLSFWKFLRNSENIFSVVFICLRLSILKEFISGVYYQLRSWIKQLTCHN